MSESAGASGSRSGLFVVVEGVDGAGKSTLLRSLADALRNEGEQIVETIQLHLSLSASAAKSRAIELLEAVSIPNPAERFNQYPHQFSGGMRQRVVIALALCSDPSLIIADEPTTALDVSIQADILNMLKNLQQDLGLTFLFISHDLSVVAHTCDLVAVMYLGSLVEVAPTRKLFTAPKHPYTKALLSAIPSLDPDDDREAERLTGEIPSPTNPPSGCRFHTRCPVARPDCAQSVPSLESAGTTRVACHYWQESLAAG